MAHDPAAMPENGLAILRLRLLRRRPIVAGACPACIWGPIAAFTRQSPAAYGSPFLRPILEDYGLDRLESWGGTIIRRVSGENVDNRRAFDVAITAHGGLANNVENDLPYQVTHKFDLQFLEFAPGLMARMSERYLLEIAPLPVGLGVEPLPRRVTTPAGATLEG